MGTVILGMRTAKSRLALNAMVPKKRQHILLVPHVKEVEKKKWIVEHAMAREKYG